MTKQNNYAIIGIALGVLVVGLVLILSNSSSTGYVAYQPQSQPNCGLGDDDVGEAGAFIDNGQVKNVESADAFCKESQYGSSCFGSDEFLCENEGESGFICRCVPQCPIQNSCNGEDSLLGSNNGCGRIGVDGVACLGEDEGTCACPCSTGEECEPDAEGEDFQCGGFAGDSRSKECIPTTPDGEDFNGVPAGVCACQNQDCLEGVKCTTFIQPVNGEGFLDVCGSGFCQPIFNTLGVGVQTETVVQGFCVCDQMACDLTPDSGYDRCELTDNIPFQGAPCSYDNDCPDGGICDSDPQTGNFCNYVDVFGCSFEDCEVGQPCFEEDDLVCGGFSINCVNVDGETGIGTCDECGRQCTFSQGEGEDPITSCDKLEQQLSHPDVECELTVFNGDSIVPTSLAECACEPVSEDECTDEDCFTVEGEELCGDFD